MTIDTLFKSLKEGKTFFLIAGPCVIETEDIMLQTAEYLKNVTSKLNIPFIFKSSYMKANRTAVDSYTGPGFEQGLALLYRIKREFDVPILTDVHETTEVSGVAEVADILQIPAFLCRQTALIVAAAKTGKIINLKKGQFLAPEDMAHQVEKVTSCGNEKILLTERGTSFGYHNLVVDFRSFPIMSGLGYPVIFDVTHSMQRPSQTKTSGGTPEHAFMMASAALATGFVNGLFIETHPQPEKALSDSSTQMQLASIKKVLEKCLKIKGVV
ncbi:MAG: 3-deoxy-8-phosphooctulonate synthase [Candidatus Cloacimonetes bacterium]|nr:3-deoxy-8-phosphooctulonate synthase [Candidatus Cloacimonadota bacterium]